MKQRLEREKRGLDKARVGGGLGLVNLNERNNNQNQAKEWT